MRAAPAAIGGMPRSSKRASERQSATSSRSPCTTWIAIAVWPSLKVVKSCARATGIVELRGMIFSVRPPIVSTPSDSGITSSSSQSSPLPRRLPASEIRLDRRAERDDLVRVEIRERRLAEVVFDRAANHRHARRAADQHDALDVGRRDFRVAQRLARRRQRARHERFGERRELRLADRDVDPPAGRKRDFDACFLPDPKALPSPNARGRAGGARPRAC